MKYFINLQRDAWDGFSGNWDERKTPTKTANTVENREGFVELEVKKTKMKHFINGFKKGFLGTWYFIGKYASAFMFFISLIEGWRGLYLSSAMSLLTAILFALWDIQKEIRDKK